MPVVRKLETGLWEVRSRIKDDISRVSFAMHGIQLFEVPERTMNYFVNVFQRYQRSRNFWEESHFRLNRISIGTWRTDFNKDLTPE
jgi:hypothetical protein